MRATRLLLTIVALALPLAGVSAAPQPDAGARAVQAYIAAQQAEAARARDQLVINHATELTDDAASPVIGNPQGNITIVEFFDYACPYCKAIEPRLESFLKADKRTKLVIKEFPILTPASMVATRAALAAARQGKYMVFHNALMTYQGALDDDAIFGTAKAVGLDVARLRKDMAAPDITDEIIANFNLARGLRLFQTPSFIVGGHILTMDSADINFPKLVAAARAK